MKIALLTDGIYPFTIGGMQKHSYYLAKFLAKHGMELDVIIPRIKNKSISDLTDLLSPEEQNNLNFIEVHQSDSFYFPGHYIYESYKYSENIFNKIINQISDYDFIYAQGFTAWKLIKEKNKDRISLPPVGVNFHGMEAFQLSANFKSSLEKLLLSFPMKYSICNADFVFSLGGKLTDIIKNITKREDNILEVPIGIENKWITENNTDTGKKRGYVFIGRYERRKGIEELHKVIKNFKNKYEYTFDFIGPIPESKRLDFNNVTYHGPIYGEDKIIEILDLNDILVCPSYSEGMPTVILEAMSRGLAVIATDVGAVNCLVSEKTGWLIPAANNKKLKKIFEESLTINDNLLLQKKKNAKRLITDSFIWDEIAKENIQKMKEVIS